jgi:cell wall-associated NlpC family hydrolase
VERLPHGRHQQHDSRSARSRGSGSGSRGAGRRPLRWTGLTIVTGALALAGVIVPAGAAGAAPSAGTPSLKATLAQANKLSNEIDSLGQQYDELRIQLTQARREAKIARQTAKRDEKLMASGQSAIGQMAAEGYMNGSMDPTLQMLQTNNPQQFLNQASIMLQLQQENGDKLSVVSSAETAAKRADLVATQQETQAAQLSTAMHKKVAAIQTKERVLNSSAFTQAMAIFQHTGNYPAIAVNGSSLEVEALRLALGKRGDPYQWGAAGPDLFDCSGLVKWAYGQLGVNLPHFTGDQWNDGVHVSKDELQPGDIVFFYNLDHEGIYVGGGLFLDAPQTGEVVQVQPMLWSVYSGAVRIA